MDTLKELKEWVLENPESRHKIFEDADYWLVKYDERPEMFVLPARYRNARPIVETFAGDSLGYAAWLRKFTKNYFERGEEAAKAINAVAAKAQCRGINRRKRNLELDAIAIALRSGRITDTPLEKQRFKRRLSEWIKRQYNLVLDAARRGKPSERLTLEERETLSLEFWDNLAQRIASGELPDL